MKNTWLDEIQVRDIAEDISKSLGVAFIGTKMNMEDWGKHSLRMMKGLKTRIRDSLMWRYTFMYELDEQGHVQTLEFVKLPWVV